MALGRHENIEVLHTKLESALAGVGRNNLCAKLLFEMALGRHENTKFCTKLENLHWQGWAGIIYVNIFYLKWLWEGMKTPSFAHEIGESALAGMGRNNAYVNIFYLKWLREGMKTPSYCTRNWRICTGRGGQEEYM